MNSKSKICSLIAGAAFTLALGASAVSAQPGPGNRWFGGGPGMMMGPWSMGGSHLRNMCSPRGMGFAEWRVQRMERMLKPTDAQKAKLEDLKKATEKAAEVMSAACPTEPPSSPAARLEFMEKRTEAMLTALKTIRPAFDAFFATLTDEQKAQFDAIGPRGRGRNR